MPSPQIVRAMQQAVAHHQAGRLEHAEQIYRDVLRQSPRDSDALQLLGLLHHQSGRHNEAIELISKAITIRPRPEFYVNLSQAQRSAGKVQESLASCQRAVQMAPNIPEAWNNLGSALKDVGRRDEAIDAFRKAIALRPKYAVALNNLGNTLAAMNRPDEAETLLRQAMAADPKYAEAYSNLGHLIGRVGRLDESISLCRQAIAIRPNLVAAYMNLGVALHLEGRFDEGSAAFEQGARLDPSHARLHENLLSGYNHTTRVSPQQVYEAHVAWAKKFAEPATPVEPVIRDRDPDRRLRIGLISPDLKRHSVAYFLQPLFEHHDREKFEITAYSNTDLADDVTEQLERSCARWRDIVTMSDEQVVEMIRADEIDILIDLAGHTTGNRLAVFGRKPAPIQMTYLGYPNTTGLSTIDYRVTDEVADPPGMTEAFHSEKLLRLPAPFLCYQPPGVAPDLVEPPMLRNGYVTFGSFNKAAKAGPETIALWSAVLRALPTSKLIMKSRGLASEGSRRRIIDAFASHGVSQDRLQLIEAEQPLATHLSMYGQIDIALDTFPYHGTTTTCEAMWMGVPVITRAGPAHVSRVGVSLLTAVGLSDLVAEADELFVAKAVAMTSKGAELTGLRAGLRDRMQASPLCDQGGFAKRFEVALRALWKAKVL